MITIIEVSRRQWQGTCTYVPNDSHENVDKIYQELKLKTGRNIHATIIAYIIHDNISQP